MLVAAQQRPREQAAKGLLSSGTLICPTSVSTDRWQALPGLHLPSQSTGAHCLGLSQESAGFPEQKSRSAALKATVCAAVAQAAHTQGVPTDWA